MLRLIARGPVSFVNPAAPCSNKMPIFEHGDNPTAHPTASPIAEPSGGWGASAATGLTNPVDAEVIGYFVPTTHNPL